MNEVNETQSFTIIDLIYLLRYSCLQAKEQLPYRATVKHAVGVVGQIQLTMELLAVEAGVVSCGACDVPVGEAFIGLFISIKKPKFTVD